MSLSRESRSSLGRWYSKLGGGGRGREVDDQVGWSNGVVAVYDRFVVVEIFSGHTKNLDQSAQSVNPEANKTHRVAVWRWLEERILVRLCTKRPPDDDVVQQQAAPLGLFEVLGIIVALAARPARVDPFTKTSPTWSKSIHVVRVFDNVAQGARGRVAEGSGFGIRIAEGTFPRGSVPTELFVALLETLFGESTSGFDARAVGAVHPIVVFRRDDHVDVL